MDRRWNSPAAALVVYSSLVLHCGHRRRRKALSAWLPEHAPAFQSNFNSLKNDLLELDVQFKMILKNADRKPLITSHPVYQYFQRAYNLQIKNLHWEPDERLSDEQWGELKLLLEEHPAHWMIWEATPLAETVIRLQQLGIESIVFNPCGNRPDQGDYLTVMQKNLDNLKTVFASE